MDPLILSTLLFSNEPVDDGLSWNAMGFADSVAGVVTDKQQRIVVLDRKGRVFRMSAGGRWEEIFSPSIAQSNPEDLLLDAESTMGEILEGIDEGSTFYDEETEQTIVEEGQQTFDDEVQGGVFDPLREEGSKTSNLGLFSEEELLLLCVDQCYESENGQEWKQITIPPATDLVSMIVDGKKFFLASTQKGLWYRHAKGSWKLANISLRNFPFLDLEVVEGGVLAASKGGLFRSNNALFWRRQGSMNNIQQVENNNGVTYISTPSGLYASIDEGMTQTLVQDGLGNRIGMFSIDNAVWFLARKQVASLQGQTVQDQSRSLQDVTFSSFVSWRNGIVVGTNKGAFLLSPEEELMTVTMPHSLENVLDMVLYDIDQQAQDLSIQNPLLTGALSPVVSLTGSLDRDMTITIDYGGISSAAQERIAWDVGLNICFGRCGSIASTASTDLQEDELMVINGSVYSRGGVAAAASGLELGLSKKRNVLFDRTIALYQSHRRLLMQKERYKTNPISVIDEVLLDLDLAEVVAQLDALTYGRYGQQE